MGAVYSRGVECIGSGEKKETVKGSGSWKREVKLEESEARRGIEDKWDKFAVGRSKGRKKVDGTGSKMRGVEL